MPISPLFSTGAAGQPSKGLLPVSSHNQHHSHLPSHGISPMLGDFKMIDTPITSMHKKIDFKSNMIMGPPSART
jgi:hypothetical protein